jgi:hypothetical protein
MAADQMKNLKPGDYPLTVTATMDDDDREVHRTQLAQPSDLQLLTEDGYTTPHLEERFPGKKKIKVVDAHGKTRFEKKVSDDS